MTFSKTQVWEKYSPVQCARWRGGAIAKQLESGLISCWFHNLTDCVKNVGTVKCSLTGGCRWLGQCLWGLCPGSSLIVSFCILAAMKWADPVILVCQPSNTEPCDCRWKPSKLWTKITLVLALAFSGDFHSLEQLTHTSCFFTFVLIIPLLTFDYRAIES